MYKTQDGFQSREKSGIEPGRVLNDPAFQRTRETLAEFAQVVQSAKLKRSNFTTGVRHVVHFGHYREKTFGLPGRYECEGKDDSTKSFFI
jgi:hypothetical protein